MELFNYEHKQNIETTKQYISNWLENASIKDIEYIYKTILNIKDLK